MKILKIERDLNCLNLNDTAPLGVYNYNQWIIQGLYSKALEHDRQPDQFISFSACSLHDCVFNQT